MGKTDTLERDRRYRKKHRKKYNERRRNQNIIIRKKLYQILGNKCIICGVTSNKPKGIIFHEIHGKPHKDNPYYILNHIEDFVPLCKNCHSTYHRFIRYMDRFIKLLIRGRKII